MVHTENVTNREILSLAMPLVSLTNEQWKTLLEHKEELKITKREMSEILDILLNNQARLEIMGQYWEYYGGVMDRPLEDENKFFQIT